MKIWTTDNTSGLQDAGAFRRVGAPVPGQGDVLVEVTDAVALAVDASAWYVPPGHSANIELLQALKEDGRLIYVTANGLGRNSIASLRQLMQGTRWVLTYHDVGAGDVAYFQQLAWLRAQPEPSAVVSADLHRLMVASFIEPDALIYIGSGTPLDDLLRVLGTFVWRPLSPPEVDMLEEGEASLSVRQPCAAGAVLRQEDLAVVVTRPRGLSPMLREAVIGCALRYPIAPGEPLTFGHLYSGTKA